MSELRQGLYELKQSLKV